MFRCKQCGSCDFRLMIHPKYQEQVTLHCNESHDVIIRIPGKEFMADLGFINQYATCGQCESVKSWEYYYPNVTTANDPAAEEGFLMISTPDPSSALAGENEI
ncbi:MAG: hypothetical protein SFZ03_06255 [Candidatus Melainabacteria bacterium]|nr:hypothetical protein [Candidatus Melainabacteria bacterium]